MKFYIHLTHYFSKLDNTFIEVIGGDRQVWSRMCCHSQDLQDNFIGVFTEAEVDIDHIDIITLCEFYTIMDEVN